jgi:hypothetical protein
VLPLQKNRLTERFPSSRLKYFAALPILQIAMAIGRHKGPKGQLVKPAIEIHRMAWITVQQKTPRKG